MDRIIKKDKRRIDKMMDDLVRKDKPRDKAIHKVKSHLKEDIREQRKGIKDDQKLGKILKKK